MKSKFIWLVALFAAMVLVACEPVEEEDEGTVDLTDESVSAEDADGSTSTGSPADVDSFSLSIDDAVVSGALDTNGLNATMSIFVGDRFNKAVDDGTVVYLWAEHGFFEQNFCLTTKGACNVTWVSSGMRPVDGLATILVYAVGEDSYIESGEANGIYNVASDTVGFDDTALSSDEARIMAPEAFKDYGFDGVYDESPQVVRVNFDVDFDGDIDVNDTITIPEDTYLDYNNNGEYDDTSAVFRGTDCSAAATAAGHCADESIYVWDTAQLVLGYSNDAPVITPSTATATIGTPFTVSVTDSLGNRPATGTSITIDSTDDADFEANVIGGDEVGAVGSAGAQAVVFTLNIIAGNATNTATITVNYLGVDYKVFVDY